MKTKSDGTRRATLGMFVLVTALTAYACTVSGHAHGKTTLGGAPFPTVTVGVDINPPEDGTVDVDGGKSAANKCVEVTWTDSKGDVLSKETLQTGAKGHASGKVPAGAVRYEAELVDCPEDMQKLQAPGLGSIGGALGRHPAPLHSYFFFGGPVVPSDDPGADNLTYAINVRAATKGHAERVAKSLILGGIGTPVPAGATVLQWTTMEVQAGGARLVQAQPGVFASWNFDFNSGAFSADLLTNSLHYPVQSWDVVEALVPLSAFDFGLLPGAWYQNTGSSVYRTDILPQEVSPSYLFGFSN